MQTLAVRKSSVSHHAHNVVSREVSCALSTGLPTAPPPARLSGDFLGIRAVGPSWTFREALAYVIFEGCLLATAVRLL